MGKGSGAGVDATVPVLIEVGRRWVFASALDWPGWSRSGRTVELAIAELASFRSRYAAVAGRAGLTVPDREFAISVRAPGISANADFGSIGKAIEQESEPVGAAAGHRLAGLLEACWDEFDRAAALAPEPLPKGPRRDGHDTGEVIRHVLAAEAMYAGRLGLRTSRPWSPGPAGVTAADLTSSEVAALRARIAALIRSGSEHGPDPGRAWPPRYAARRIGWHVLDHAWELQDRSGPAG